MGGVNYLEKFEHAQTRSADVKVLVTYASARLMNNSS